MLAVYELHEKVIHLICFDVELHQVIYQGIFEDVQGKYISSRLSESTNP